MPLPLPSTRMADSSMVQRIALPSDVTSCSLMEVEPSAADQTLLQHRTRRAHEVTIFGLSEPSFVLPYPNAAHPHHGEEKGRRCRLLLRGVAASHATMVTRDGPKNHSDGYGYDRSRRRNGRDCDGNVSQRAAAWLKNMQETSNAGAKRRAAAQTAAAAGAAQ
ncbi:hypothetical protein BJV78DRAFT_1310141 [Lactifluus subvellereus]|nr:hypothetical protein BJV78DRAFT_1310141 [Lactifluus subvellereus]